MYTPEFLPPVESSINFIFFRVSPLCIPHHSHAICIAHNTHIDSKIRKKIKQGSPRCALITLLLSPAASLRLPPPAAAVENTLVLNWGPDVSFAFHTHTSFSLLCCLLLSLSLYPSRISSAQTQPVHVHTHSVHTVSNRTGQASY